jgi:hypothetical protein
MGRWNEPPLARRLLGLRDSGLWSCTAEVVVTCHRGPKFAAFDRQIVQPQKIVKSSKLFGADQTIETVRGEVPLHLAPKQ